MAERIVEKRISHILQRMESSWEFEQESHGSLGSGVPNPFTVEYCRVMDCWAASSAMVRGFNGGSAQQDGAAIDRIFEQYSAWVRENNGARMTAAGRVPLPGDNGINDTEAQALCSFLSYSFSSYVDTIIPIPTIPNRVPIGTATRAQLIQALLEYLERAPVLLFNVVLNRDGRPVGRHVTVLSRLHVATATTDTNNLTEDDAESTMMRWADPWIRFNARHVFTQRRGWREPEAQRRGLRWGYFGRPDSPTNEGMLRTYSRQFRIEAVGYAPFRTQVNATPNGTTTVTR